MTSPALVLVSPQDIVNIAAAVRIAKNFAIEDLRLVAPAVFDAWRIEGIAHNTADLVERIRVFDTLDEAVADCVWVVGLTARSRTAKRTVLRPAAPPRWTCSRASRRARSPWWPAGKTRDLPTRNWIAATPSSPFPTSKEYSSLNLAQAVAVMSYELWLARGGEAQPLKPPRKSADPALAAQLERLFGDWEQALWAIEFFKTRQAESVMRSFREVIYRAGLDGREAALVRAMGIEVRRFLERKGIPSRGTDANPRLRASQTSSPGSPFHINFRAHFPPDRGCLGTFPGLLVGQHVRRFRAPPPSGGAAAGSAARPRRPGSAWCGRGSWPSREPASRSASWAPSGGGYGSTP